MEIGVVEIRSAITPVNEESVSGFFGKIEKAGEMKLKFIGMNDYAEAEFPLIFIATGGTEGLFLENFASLSARPCFLLTSGESNSLAASMEILSYLKSHGHQGEILHGDPERIAERIQTLYTVERAKRNIRGMRFGAVGSPSDWLIDSNADAGAYRDQLGVEIVPVEIQELIDETKKGGYRENEWTKRLMELGYDKEEMRKSLNVYGALKRIVEKYQLSAVTVRCFDLLNTVNTTGCLALSILNAEGIYAGCEGDMPALMSMVILGEISGKPIFMCNLNRIDTINDELIFAHCTLPTNMPYKMSLTTHYESGIGVAIAGSIPEEDFTIFKISGDLSRCFAESGRILENRREKALCRTQIKVKLSDYEYFIKNPIANHHVVCVGNYKRMLDEFFNFSAY